MRERAAEETRDGGGRSGRMRAPREGHAQVAYVGQRGEAEEGMSRAGVPEIAVQGKTADIWTTGSRRQRWQGGNEAVLVSDGAPRDEGQG